MTTKLVVIFLISVLILSGCVTPPTNPMDEIPEGYVEIPSSSDCQNLTGNNEECFYKAALWENNPENCNKSGPLKDQCFMELAINEYNQEQCQLAGSNEGKCIYAFAMLEIDETLCEKAIDFKARCYHQLAILTLNPELCNKTDTEFQKNVCLEEVEYEIYLKESKIQKNLEIQKLIKKKLNENKATL